MIQFLDSRFGHSTFRSFFSYKYRRDSMKVPRISKKEFVRYAHFRTARDLEITLNYSVTRKCGISSGRYGKIASSLVVVLVDRNGGEQPPRERRRDARRIGLSGKIGWFHPRNGESGTCGEIPRRNRGIGIKYWPGRWEIGNFEVAARAAEAGASPRVPVPVIL